MVRTAEQENSIANVWRDLFATWPAAFRRKGVVIPTFDEAIPFSDFVINGDVVVLERATPDSVGARRIAIPFALILSVKYTEPLNTEQFLENGFVTSVSNAAARPKNVAVGAAS